MNITAVAIFDRVIDFMYNDVQPEAQNYINILVSIYDVPANKNTIANQGTAFLNQVSANYPQECLMEIANGQFQNNDTLNLVREISQYLLSVIGPSVDDELNQQRSPYPSNTNTRNVISSGVVSGGYPSNNAPLSARELAGRNLTNNLHPNANNWGSVSRGRVVAPPTQIRGNYDIDVNNVFTAKTHHQQSNDYQQQGEIKMPKTINNSQNALAAMLREIDEGNNNVNKKAPPVNETKNNEVSNTDAKTVNKEPLPLASDIDSALEKARQIYDAGINTDSETIQGVPEYGTVADFKLPQLKQMTEEEYMEYITHELNIDEKTRYNGLPDTLESCKASIDELKQQIQTGELDITNPSIKLSSEGTYLYPSMLMVPSMQAINGSTQYTINQATLGKIIIHLYNVTGEVQGAYITDAALIARLKDLKEGTLTAYKLNTLFAQVRKSGKSDAQSILSNLTDCIGKWVDEAIKFKIGANNAVKIDKFTLTDDFENDLKIYLIKNGYASEQANICKYLIDTIDSLRYYLPFIKSSKELTIDQPSAIDYIIDETHLDNIYYTLTPVIDVVVPFNLNALKVKFKTKLVKDSYRADASDNKVLFEFYESVLKIIKESPTFDYTGDVTLICRDTSGNQLEFKKCYAQSANVIISKI